MADAAGTLVDGSSPATPDDLFALLEELGVDVSTVTHDRVFTVEEAKAERDHMPGCHTKNLFLRDQKERMWLLVCEQDQEVDLLALGDAIGARGRLSFGSEGRLMRYLGVVPGAVNPFALMNDVRGKVTLVLDRTLLACDLLNFHPLDNRMTTAIEPEGFRRFLEAVDHPPVTVDLNRPG